jgi:hypothetical protein
MGRALALIGKGLLRVVASPFLLFNLLQVRKQQRLARTRKGIDEEEFVRRVAELAGDSQAARWVWRHLKEWGYASGFTPYPNDDLGSVFGIGEEGLDEDLVLTLLLELKVPVPDNEFLQEFGVVDTPLRVVQLVTLCRKLPASSQATAMHER